MERFLNLMDGRYAAEKKTVLRLFNRGTGYCVSDLARELGISIPKVTRILNELIEEGYLIETGKLESATGRRPSVYGLNPEAGYFVGIEVAEDGLAIAITDFPGQTVLFQPRLPYRLANTRESVLDLCKTVLDFLSAQGIDQQRVRAYGVSLTGRVNYRTGYSYSYFISEENPIRDILESGFGKSVFVENDSRAMTYGEYVKGVTMPEDGTILFLNVGWGLGMGMVLGGRLFHGKSGFSGEIGHFPLLDNNQYCRCGKIGCLETGASGLALHRLVLERLKEGRPSLLSQSFRDGQEISLENILEAIRKEDMTAIECLEEVGSTLGRAVAGLINVFNPDLVIIGGRLSETERYLMPPLRSAVNKYSLNLVNSDTQIKASRLGRQAGAVGASLLSKRQMMDEAF